MESIRQPPRCDRARHRRGTFVRFRQARTTTNPMDPSKASRLVTDGVFCVSRNPMYLGLELLLIGWAVWLGSASP
ncbi:protein-S-isoprenylcysteine O-methyltransferase Ste14 [Paraburkholderia sp. GAS448]|uniref:methyltransferase family protein n=1 Tax=Paraburkholderia sp. GAS448 TaxID=3035136 RepID=UPI003D232668